METKLFGAFRGNQLTVRSLFDVKVFGLKSYPCRYNAETEKIRFQRRKHACGQGLEKRSAFNTYNSSLSKI